MTAEEAAPRTRLYGRRKGKPLSARRTGLMDGGLSGLGIDLTRPSDLGALFAAPVTDCRLEVGFGGGEHLIHEARANPGIGHIGVEPFQNGLAKAVAAVVEGGDRNVRLYEGDAAFVLDWLPEGSLSRVDVFYPDPWPKKRHWKRRFVSAANLDRIARALRPGGHLRVASDIEAYIDWTLRLVMARHDLAWTAERADDWRSAYAGWPGTRYEAKALREGRRPAYLDFVRV
jgi:tRNA (guanine-N7-)-methyltransferase